MGKLTCLASI